MFTLVEAEKLVFFNKNRKTMVSSEQCGQNRDTVLLSTLHGYDDFVRLRAPTLLNPSLVLFPQQSA